MTVADLIAEYGAYYQNRGQRLADLYRVLLAQMVTWGLFQTVMRDDSIYEAADTEISELLQPFQKTWTPKGVAVFKPHAIRAFKMKVDYEAYPDDIDDTWAGFLADNGLNRKDWPVIKYVMEQLMTPRVADDIETKAIYDGVRVNPTTGVAGAAAESMDGVKKIINDGIDNGTIAPITMGAIPTTSSGDKSADHLFVDYVEDFVKQISVRYRMAQMPLAMSEDLEFRYMNGFHEKYNVNYSQDTMATKVRHRKINIIGLPSMAGSDKIWMTPPANAKKLVRRGKNIGNYAVEQEDRKVKIWTDFYLGVGFVLHELVWTNDQDLTVV